MKKILILITAVIIASCSDNLESLNENIKDPSSVPGETLFTGAQKNLVDQVVDLNVNNNNTKLWAQYLQETTYLQESQYDQVTRTIPATHWSVLYKDVLKDLDEAAKVIEETQYSLPTDIETKANKLQVIEILTVYTYSILVETFGNVPYAEALDIDDLLPTYDEGETVYKTLIERLTVTINALDTSKGSFGLADNIYGGDTSLWKKFAASLKLRMGILLSDVDNAFAKTTVEDAVTSGVFTSRADNANFTYLAAAPNTNPIHNNLVLSGRNDFVAAVTIVDMMNTLNDPRRPLYFLEVPGTGNYIGGGIGMTSDFDSHSHVSAQVEAATTPGVILDYAEVEFLLAEAAARTFAVGGTAKSHYDIAVVESIESWGGSNADAMTYLAQPTVDYDTALAASTATTPWKEVIGNQKWIALFNRGLEAWTSIRLLDFPTLATPDKPKSGFPNRYTYPVIEQTLNPTNWTAGSAAIGGDLAETKLFWDLN
ncbi:SusD-like starch-binding protein associating with outer membrane [Aquimarina sp. MAR_2010_214]|uniref:SusD/RagB family nutrient-binding outer membrane lipoprotein n=1 Tax=Aquimarina sp. MAR_2010_214 TaxID=1250026 RepID=UPI000C6FF182|nr:SusD/RagB family nutrient-binding outer membrane lipoprotein [Aquimarina sp. MAR_2010_214]PKV50105.1 SusD-like starch-binding protein associating with outer membrane [Aquimarina sp. MAR_2010_214]